MRVASAGLNRGGRREDIFRGDAVRQRFLDTLSEAGGRTGWQILAPCLLPDPFHLVAETPQTNLVAGMEWLLGTCSADAPRRWWWRAAAVATSRPYAITCI